MKRTFGFGKRLGRGRLAPEQADVVGRFERGEITAEEAEAELGGRAREWKVTLGKAEDTKAEPASPSSEPGTATPETEDERARALVERIAAEVDAETGR